MDLLLRLLGLALLLTAPLLYLVVQARQVRRWVGVWRLAAGLPLLGWAIWFVGFARDVSLDPTPHNLFPFEILIGAGTALLYLGCLAMVRKVVRAARG